MLLTFTMSLAISRLSESALVHLGMYNARQVHFHRCFHGDGVDHGFIRHPIAQLESVRSGDTLRAYVKISEVFQTSKRWVFCDR